MTMTQNQYSAMSTPSCCCSSQECKELGCKIVRDANRLINEERILADGDTIIKRLERIERMLGI